jgi:hypothetical protein
MKRFIILATIICLASFTVSQDVEKIEETLDCLKTESYTHLRGLVLDLYYGKVNFSIFVSKYLEWTSRSDSSILRKCLPFFESQKSNLYLQSALSKVGMTLLYASNCEKDLGPSFIILDTIISNLENVNAEWKKALVNTLTLGLIGYQSVKDCRSALENIRDIWTHSHK